MIARPRVTVATPGGRRDQLAMTAMLVGWLAYTRFLPVLSTVHATLPPCPFYLLTGHPCPFCGGTRSFAAMWRGDLGASARYYPLGPLLFFLTFAVAGYTAWSALRGRQLQLGLSRAWVRGLIGACALVLAVSWSLKLFWLGN